MNRVKQLGRGACVVGIMVMLAACTYETAIRQLPPAEQREFFAHRQMMTRAQERTYLAQTTAAARTAYLESIGVAQRFQALAPQDRASVLAGIPRQGMSEEALRFLWGEPYHREGHRGHYEYWYYLGSAPALTAGNVMSGHVGTMVEVYVVDGQVDSWLEVVPSSDDDPGEDGDRQP